MRIREGKVRFNRKPHPIRVLHVLANFRTGGTEQGLINLINCSDPARIQVGVCVFDDIGAEESLSRLKNPEVYFRTAAKRFSNDPGTGWRLARCIEKEKFQLVHSHGWPTYLETWAALKLNPRVSALHGEHGTSFLERRRRRWAFGMLAGRWQRFLFVSKNLRDLFHRQTRIPLERMSVIPNGVDFDRFKAVGNLPRNDDPRFQSDWFHIGTAGRLHEVKNHCMLLRVAERARARGLRWKIHLAGDGPLRTDYEMYIRNRDLAKHVCLHGRVDDMATYYQSLNLFVLTSRTEGHPNALLEALASGLPVISTPVGDVPEFLIEGENGWLIPHDDVDALMARLTECTKDNRLCRDVATRGKQVAQDRFSIAAMVESYSRLYEESARPNCD